jgi:hypothetical protein
MTEAEKEIINHVCLNKIFYEGRNPWFISLWKIVRQHPELMDEIIWPEMYEALKLMDLSKSSFTDSLTQDFIDAARYNYIALSTLAFYSTIPSGINWFEILPKIPRALNGQLPLYAYMEFSMSHQLLIRIIKETSGDYSILDILKHEVNITDDDVARVIDDINPDWIYRHKGLSWQYSSIPNTLKLHPELIQFDHKISQLKQSLALCDTLEKKYEVIRDTPQQDLCIILIQLLEEYTQ